MGWTEREVATGKETDVTTAKAQLLDEVKKSSLPIVQKEADGGVRPFETVKLQPVRATDTFEAEFGVKGEDVIFHIWPWNYHVADRKEGTVLPKFRKDFETILRASFGKVYDSSRVQASYDGDLGSWFVLVKGYAQNQFHRNVCIEAVTLLHKALGGTEG